MNHTHTHAPAPQTRGRTIHWAHRYDWLTNLMLLGHERALRDLTVEMAAIKPGDKVLDVGCGTGSLTLAVPARAGESDQVYGIDAAPEMIAVAQSKAARSGAKVDFQIGLIEKIPFPDNYFDVVLSSLMIHHLPDDLKHQGFCEIRRVLKPGGHLFVVDFEPPTSPLLRHLLAHALSHDMMRVDVRTYADVEGGRIQTGGSRQDQFSLHFVCEREPELERVCKFNLPGLHDLISGGFIPHQFEKPAFADPP